MKFGMKGPDLENLLCCKEERHTHTEPYGEFTQWLYFLLAKGGCKILECNSNSEQLQMTCWFKPGTRAFETEFLFSKLRIL